MKIKQFSLELITETNYRHDIISLTFNVKYRKQAKIPREYQEIDMMGGCQ
jgi:hypothetical protein